MTFYSKFLEIKILKIIIFNIFGQPINLESQLLEKPLILTSLISFFKNLLDVSFGSLLLSSILQLFLVNNILVQLNINRVSGGEHVIVVDNFDKSLHLVSLGDLFLAHRFGDSSGISFDTGDQGVAVKSVVGSTFVGFFDDDGFSASLSASGDDDGSSGFEESDHFDCFFFGWFFLDFRKSVSST